MHRSRRFTPLFLVALGLLLALPGGALAGNDTVIREQYSDAFTVENMCDVPGFTVAIVGEGTFRATIHNWVIGPADPPADNFWIGNIQDHGSATYTNPANGRSVVGTWRTNIKEASMVYVGDGNWEYTYAVNGIPVRLGGNLIKDRGHVVVTDTIHLGDLSTDADDYFVSGIAHQIAGPHPAFNSYAWCTALIGAIG